MTIDQRNARERCRFPGGHQKGSCPGKSTEIVGAHDERLRALEIVEVSLPDFKKSGPDI
jgi:hypothetical protein